MPARTLFQTFQGGLRQLRRFAFALAPGLEAQGASPLPPGSLGLPVIGETISYARNPHRFVETRWRKYGPVFKTRLLGRPVVCFVGPEAFSFYVDSRPFTRAGANPGHVQRLLCQYSLPLIDGVVHARMKRAVLKAFEPQVLDQYVPLVDATAGPFLERWERIATFAWVPELKKLAAAICSSLLAGAEPGTDAPQLYRHLDEFMAGLTAIPVRLPWTTYGRALRRRDELLADIDVAIKEHRRVPVPDMLTALVSQAGGADLSEQQLRAQMVHMYFAAYGGIFRTLTYLCLSLAQHPDVMERARTEVLRVAPKGPLSLEQLGSLTFLDQVTQEVRRFHRIFALTFLDQAEEPVEFNGYRLPKGWRVAGSIYATMQDTHAFSSPDRFDPDRFGRERAEHLREENCYIPQGGGSMEGHRCPGEDFTTILMKIVAVLLLRTYTWELLPQDLRLTNDPSPLPRDGLKVMFRRLPSTPPLQETTPGPALDHAPRNS